MTTGLDRHAVMFADVAGSTRLYEALGDKEAQALISQCLGAMSEITRRRGGVVIKTIGDEIMCRFGSADDAVGAACDIQEAMERDTTSRNGVRIAVRVGLHWGPAILEAGDVFGDAVNIAARMAGIAKARQIITTEETIHSLSPEHAERARLFDRALVKGKQVEIVIYEVVWEEQDDVTTMAAIRSTGSQAPANEPMRVRCGHTEKPVPADGSAFVLGRADNCSLVVPAPLASRQHARIEFRRGKYILVDQSTNGTWVRLQDGKDVYLRREELPLWGAGIISLGEEVRADNPDLVHFRTPL